MGHSTKNGAHVVSVNLIITGVCFVGFDSASSLPLSILVSIVIKCFL